MKEIHAVLSEKVRDLVRVRKEVVALKTALPLLEEPGDKPSPPTESEPPLVEMP